MTAPPADAWPPPARPAYQFRIPPARHSRPAPVMAPNRPAPRPDTEAAIVRAMGAQRRAALACAAAVLLKREAAQVREQRRRIPRRPAGPAAPCSTSDRRGAGSAAGPR
jgi:hypothetical protein